MPTKKNNPFVYYRMPGEKVVWFLQSKSVPIPMNSLLSVPFDAGFILHPSASGSSSKPLFIRADSFECLSLENVYENIPSYDEFWESIPSVTTQNNSKKKEQYCQSVTDAIKVINSGALQKVVLSRVKNINGSMSHNPIKVFYQLCNKYPSAFVSLVYMPGNAVWITATPELLVSANRNQIETVSLAGTKPADNYKKWGEKEKKEQQIVTDYISQILEKYCKDIHVSGPEDAIAGNVKHLKTTFSAALNTGFWNLVSALFPTPAICGFPLNNAKQFIEQTEGYDRRYYTGFLGPCNIDDKTNLFVNLRCAEVFSNGVNLYIGGGITKDSIPEAEWEETELKVKTLLFAFEENEEYYNKR